MPEFTVNKNVCVIIPVYNVKLYLERCIESIMIQTYSCFDIILVDDGSTDGSSELCEEIARKYENIICYHKPNSGAGMARNYGIQKSYEGRYQYITFVDPDDTIEIEFLEKLVATIHGADLAICGYRTIIFEGMKSVEEKQYKNAQIGLFSDYAEELCLLHKNTLLFGPCNKMFRASIIYEHHIQFGNTKRYEDTAFVYRYLQHTKSIAFAPYCLYCYSKFRNGRRTAVTSFGNEHCKGAFIAYEEGLKVVAHMAELKMQSKAVCNFRQRLEEHLQTSLLGEIIVNMSIAPLTWKERRNYIVTMIENYHQYLSQFDESDSNRVGRIVRRMANHGKVNEMVLLSYLYKLKNT